MSTISSYSSIQKLLEFQNSFLNLVHSQILSFTQLQQRKQALLKFQIIRMGDKNEAFNEILYGLKKQLIEQKQQADPVLKNYFMKVLQLDFMPFMHINRYELTKLAIFGFDIYIDPLEAILQILNRLERIFYILEESLKQQQIEFQKIIQQKKSSWEILFLGWKPYYTYLHFYKLSLNIYMLKQYIQTAGTSLFKKDKQIVFTGVYNLYKKLIPRLRQLGMVDFLLQLGELNNTMYNFHGSFDYFVFYTYLTPEKQYYKVYEKIVEVEKKCTHTNILTPLLFGVLNNYKAFVQFINDVQSNEYVHLLRVLLSGLIINFKLRILQYNQLLELIDLTITKLCLLKGMKLSIITDDLTKQWREAKEFFISAFKTGYNVGEIQTWNLCEEGLIQLKIIGFLVNGLLLQENCRDDAFVKGLEKRELEQALSSEIKELTDGSETLSSLTNNWKILSLYQKQSVYNADNQSHLTIDLVSKIQKKCFNIIRITNLLNILQNYSQKILYSIISYITEITSLNPLIISALTETSQTLNMMITVINRKETISNLKDILPKFHLKYPPRKTFEDIVPVYLHCFITREAIGNLMSVILKLEIDNHSTYIKQLLTSLIHKYCPKPSQDSHQILKNFEKQYKVPFSVTTMQSQINSVFSNLIKIITTCQDKRQLGSQMLINMLGFSPCYIICVMNLPAIVGQKIESFMSWMINNSDEKCLKLLIEILELLYYYGQYSNSLNLKEYLNECFYLSVLDNVLTSLSAVSEAEKWEQTNTNVQKALELLELFVKIESKFLKDQNSTKSNEVLQKIWSNLLELLAFILKTSQYSLSTTTSCCKLYWKIIQILKGQSIGDWYQKLLFNLIFSTFTTQNLLTYERFKGISLISNSKNYMISRQSKSQNEEKEKVSKKENFGFGQIKQFFQINYKGSVDGLNAQSEQDKSLNEFVSIIQSTRKSIKTVKTSMHLTNDKDMPPYLNQQTLQKIYQSYVQCLEKTSEESQTEKQQIEFCLHLLRLNPANHKNLWIMIKKNQKNQFLENMNFTRQTINEVLEVLSILQNYHLKSRQVISKQIGQTTSNNKNIETQFLKMLGIQLLSKNVNELQLLASSYYFDSSKIETFLNKQSFLWFLIVCNNSSWREFNEIFATYLRGKCFLSTLLQYKEYLLITKKSSDDYQRKIEEFAQLVSQYTFYVQKKMEFIHLLKTSDSQKENEIRRSTLLINVKVLLLKCEFQRILQRVGVIAKELHDNSLPDAKLKQLLASMHALNRLCNSLLEGNIQLPTFMYHNRYITSESDEKQFSLGRWIEVAEKALGSENSDKEKWNYVPEQGWFRLEKDIDSFICKDNVTEVLMRQGLQPGFDSQQCHEAYVKLKQRLDNALTIDNYKVQINYEASKQFGINICGYLYKLGYLLYGEFSREQIQKNLQNFSPILKSLIRREAIPLEIMKEVDAEAYHHLKIMLMNQKITQQMSSTTEDQQNASIQQVQGTSEKTQAKQISTEQEPIYFMWGQKQLITGGNLIKVTDQNKKEYFDLVTESILQKQYLMSNKALAVGYLSARTIRKNIQN